MQGAEHDKNDKFLLNYIIMEGWKDTKKMKQMYSA
jgi:5S rRNA maturation endonuclease (ribonuclease M5)